MEQKHAFFVKHMGWSAFVTFGWLNAHQYHLVGGFIPSENISQLG